MPVTRNHQKRKKSRALNKQVPRDDFFEPLRKVKGRTERAANHFVTNPAHRNIRAMVAQEQDYDVYLISLPQRLLRWLMAIFLLILGVITTLTLFDLLSSHSFAKGFWYSPEFWLFATGSILMSGWFFSKLQQRFFLHLYVLGHELTHAVFAMLHLGRIVELKASADGGYIATNKHNVIISLSPYFFPFWSMMIIGIYGPLAYFVDLPEKSEQVLYLLTGATWTFHILWTLWMIPRDQPDLRDNDTFFSLAMIYLANILALSLLFCLAIDSLSLLSFGAAWFIEAENLWRNALPLLRSSIHS
jgi:hypothetical protein